MSDFTSISIHNGYGNVHMNRFRICVRPPRDRSQIAAIGGSLMANMPRYMAANTASVQWSDRTWNGSGTLRFRGVARIRPFNIYVTIPVAGIPIPVPVPERVRDWMMPDLHTDCVGLVTKHGTGFTVQTLKREFEDDNDKQIRQAAGALANILAALVPGGGLLVAVIARKLADIAVYYNQCHFLAGRRAFRFDVGSSFGYRDDRCVFETVAIERFSSQVVAGSEIAMGSIPAVVKQVWGEMLTQFVRHHGLTPIVDEQPGNGWSKWGKAVHCMQTEVFPSVAEIRGNVHFGSMSAEHRDILEPR